MWIGRARDAPGNPRDCVSEAPASNRSRQSGHCIRSKTRIKIPDACNALSVPWMSLFDMLRAEGARFA
jgi:hypothetical protein